MTGSALPETSSEPGEPLPPVFRDRLRAHLAVLYPERADEVLSQLAELVTRWRARIPQPPERVWDETDTLLITYADQVRSEDGPPLEALAGFLDRESLGECLSIVHLLPFSPYSSDDGFSVIDYREVDPNSGDWGDIARLAERFRLMFDLVLNHASAQSPWFQGYLTGDEKYARYFIEADPSLDYSQVVRPRSLPLLTEFETSRGPRHIWTTFSADQVDLNFAEPAVLLEMVDVLLEYASRGAQVVRLDAVGFLWKELGTNCMHLPQTHEAVKLLRTVLEAASPATWILTETNVPHDENVSYFGEGDEAQIVYQFSLPPLLLDAFTFGEADALMAWLAGLEATPPGTTFLNFTASHDGIGMRPLEGIVPQERINAIVESVKQKGGLVSTRQKPDGTHSPYELNISYVDAMAPSGGDDPELHARRFLSSQAVMLALRGIPAIYFHSLVGSRGDLAAGREIPRRINRKKLSVEELAQQIGDGGGVSSSIYAGYRQLLKTRRSVAAFSPEADQTVLSGFDRRLIAFLRGDPGSDERVVVLANTSEETVTADARAVAAGPVQDLISGRSISDAGVLTLAAGECVWLVPAAS